MKYRPNRMPQYRSHEFFVDDKKTLGAEMPFAMPYLGDVFEGPKRRT
jgi:hypothetical protein